MEMKEKDKGENIIFQDIPDFSRVKKFKLAIHTFLLCVMLTIINLMFTDLFSLLLNVRIHANLSLLPCMLAFWVLFAIKKPRYRKN